MNFIKRMQTSCHNNKKTTKITPFFLSSLSIKAVAMGVLLSAFLPDANANTSMPNESFAHIQQQLQQIYTHKAQQQGMRNISIQIKKNLYFSQLPKCRTPLHFKDPFSNRENHIVGRHTIKISCQTPKWKTYISLQVSGTLPAIISTQGIMKNTTITSKMIKQVWQNAQSVRPQRLISLKTVIGMRAKRPIPPNKVLTIQDIVPPYLVMKKEEVIIETHIGAITIRTKGIAEKNGVKGEQIPVKNKKSGKVIKAIVSGRNLVEVP